MIVAVVAATEVKKKRSNLYATFPCILLNGLARMGVSVTMPHMARKESWNERSNSAGGAKARIITAASKRESIG